MPITSHAFTVLATASSECHEDDVADDPPTRTDALHDVCDGPLGPCAWVCGMKQCLQKLFGKDVLVKLSNVPELRVEAVCTGMGTAEMGLQVSLVGCLRLFVHFVF